MPQIKFEIPHNKTVEEVKGKVHQAIMQAAMMGEYELKGFSWISQEVANIDLRISGVDYSGEIIILPDMIKVIGQVSLAAWVFRSRIEEEIRRRITGALYSSLGGKP